MLRLTLAARVPYSLPIATSSATNILINIDNSTAGNSVSYSVISLDYYSVCGSAETSTVASMVASIVGLEP